MTRRRERDIVVEVPGLSDRTAGILMASFFLVGCAIGFIFAFRVIALDCKRMAAVEAPRGDLLEDMRRVENLLVAEGYDVKGFAHRPAPRVLVAAEIPVDCRPMVRAYALTRVALRTYSITDTYAVEHGDDRALAEEFERDTAHAIAAVFDDTDRTECLGRVLQGDR